MYKTIAIIGDRNALGSQCAILKKWLNQNHAETMTVITGGANGTDTAAMEWANSNGMASVGYLPDYAKYGKAATHVRNAKIVEATKAANGIVIAYQPNGSTPGTQSTIQKAKAAKLEVIELHLLTKQTKNIGTVTAVHATHHKPESEVPTLF
jgi:hypothetical protein